MQIAGPGIELACALSSGCSKHAAHIMGLCQQEIVSRPAETQRWAWEVLAMQYLVT